MINKTTRIPRGDAGAFAAYMGAPGENESVTWLMGNETQVRAMGFVAQMADRPYAVRHQIMSPEKKLTNKQLMKAIKNYVQEFNVSDDIAQRICVARHEKPRQDGARGSEFHYHIAIPEIDTQTGRVLDNAFTAVRNETLSRMSELQCGHPIVVGNFNREVYRYLKKEHPDLDLMPFREALEQAAEESGMQKKHWLNYRAERAGYTKEEHQIVKRQVERASKRDDFDYSEKVDIKKTRKQLKELAGKFGERRLDEFIDALEIKGYDVLPGNKKGIWRVHKGDFELGSLDRLSGLKRAPLHVALSKRQKEEGRQSNGSGEKEGRDAQVLKAWGADGRSHLRFPGGDKGQRADNSTGAGRTTGRASGGQKQDRGAAGTAGGGDRSGTQAKRRDHPNPAKSGRISKVRARANFARMKDHHHAAKCQSAYHHAVSDGGGEVFDLDDPYLMQKIAAALKKSLGASLG